MTRRPFLNLLGPLFQRQVPARIPIRVIALTLVADVSKGSIGQTFTTTKEPHSTVLVFRNGILQHQDSDFTFDTGGPTTVPGQTITFIQQLNPDDLIDLIYQIEVPQQ